ncbi:MAG: glycosyltransferase family 4 protein [Thermoplasmata archaeon]|nr:glycosyltransferase family 4 protein [Thermoplasmata archaeon]
MRWPAASSRRPWLPSRASRPCPARPRPTSETLTGAQAPFTFFTQARQGRWRRPMRIVMMTDSYFPTCDGVVTSICTIKESLEERGHEVIIVAPEPEPDKRQEGVYYFRAVKFRSYEGYYVPIFPTDKMNLMKKLKPDIIHVHGVATMAIRALFIGRDLGIPTIMTFHTMVDDAALYYMPVKMPPEIGQKLIWIYLRQILKRFDAVVTPTACIGAELEAHGAHCRHLLAVPTGAKTDVFRPGIPCEEVRERYGLGDSKVVVHVGRVSYEKNIDMVIRAMQHVDAKLLVVGKGPAMDDMKALVSELGLDDRVTFTGYVPNDELPKIYNAGDMVISASKFETQGLTILEGMATGKPVACRNGRAFAEIVTDGVNGYLFDDDEGCVEAIKKCLNAPQSVIDASYETAMANSREKSVEGYENAYRVAIEEKRSRQKKRAKKRSDGPSAVDVPALTNDGPVGQHGIRYPCALPDDASFSEDGVLEVSLLDDAVLHDQDVLELGAGDLGAVEHHGGSAIGVLHGGSWSDIERARDPVGFLMLVGPAPHLVVRDGQVGPQKVVGASHVHPDAAEPVSLDSAALAHDDGHQVLGEVEEAVLGDTGEDFLVQDVDAGVDEV